MQLDLSLLMGKRKVSLWTRVVYCRQWTAIISAVARDDSVQFWTMPSVDVHGEGQAECKFNLL